MLVAVQESDSENGVRRHSVSHVRVPQIVAEQDYVLPCGDLCRIGLVSHMRAVLVETVHDWDEKKKSPTRCEVCGTFLVGGGRICAVLMSYEAHQAPKVHTIPCETALCWARDVFPKPYQVCLSGLGVVPFQDR